MDGDGKPDIVSADYADNSISVLLNGTSPGATIPAFTGGAAICCPGPAPFAISVADIIDGDGRPDIITANKGDDSVSVLLNTSIVGSGSLSFAPFVFIRCRCIATSDRGG